MHTGQMSVSFVTEVQGFTFLWGKFPLVWQMCSNRSVYAGSRFGAGRPLDVVRLHQLQRICGVALSRGARFIILDKTVLRTIRSVYHHICINRLCL